MQGSPRRGVRRRTASPHRIRRFWLGVLMAPAVWIVFRALLDLLYSLALPEGRQVPDIAYLAAGYGLWLLIFLSLPHPVRAYVLAHELTHALWGLICGARVHRMRVSRSGGSVTLSRTNTLILLAPYFFPLYTLVLLALRLIAARFFDPRPYHPFWMAGIGFTWGFHLSFTVRSLLHRQTDLEECGWLFAMNLILLLNILGIATWTLCTTNASAADFFAALWNRSLETIAVLTALGGRLISVFSES